MHPLTTRLLTESDLDALIRWKRPAQPQPQPNYLPAEAAHAATDIGAEPDPQRTPEQRAYEWVRLLLIALAPLLIAAVGVAALPAY